MKSENGSTWFVPANSGAEIAFLIKTTTTSIKALLAGCNLGIVFGKNEQHLYTGVRIYDIPETPLLITGEQRHEEEHLALARFLEERRIPIFLFSEMDICLASADLELDEAETIELKSFMGPVDELYVGDFTSLSSHGLDCFGCTFDPTQQIEGAHKIDVREVVPKIKNWKASNVSFAGVRELHTIVIDDQSEGEMLERAAWAAIESVFEERLYKSPKIVVGSQTRELTDVLAAHDLGVFLFETKDLSVLQGGHKRRQERRTSGVQKQVVKAIGQLIGASKALKREREVIDVSGRTFRINTDQPLHCIVLLTELMHDGDWGEIVSKMMSAMRETGDFFHLFDLMELINILKSSSGDAALLDYNLMQRFKAFAERKTVHIRTRIPTKLGLPP